MKNNDGFCELKKDYKTYHILSIYIADIENEKDLLCEDLKIQEQEIIDHLKLNGFNKNDTKEQLKWIEENGKGERTYLNSIKFLYLIWKKRNTNGIELTSNIFNYIIDIYNYEWFPILDNKKISCLFTMFL